MNAYSSPIINCFRYDLNFLGENNNYYSTPFVISNYDVAACLSDNSNYRKCNRKLKVDGVSVE